MRFPARRDILMGLGAGGALALAGCGGKDDAGASSGAARIEASKTLRIGLEGTYPPFNFQGADGQLTGFDVDFAKALAAQMKVKPQFVATPFAGLLGALESGRSDVVINQITITPEREAKYDFSKPYTVSGALIIVPKGKAAGIAGPDDLAGKKVGVGLGTHYEQWLRQNQPKAIVRTYDDDPTKYQDLRAGRIDAVLNDRLVAADFLKSAPDLVAAGPPFAQQSQGVVMKRDPALKVLVDQAIDAMRADGQLAAISHKWFAQDVTR
jgi:cystine transport system substrate-binding protein